MTKEQSKEFEKLTVPLIKWLNDNTNPHAKIIVDTNSAELLHGAICLETDDYLKD